MRSSILIGLIKTSHQLSLYQIINNRYVNGASAESVSTELSGRTDIACIERWNCQSIQRCAVKRWTCDEAEPISGPNSGLRWWLREKDGLIKGTQHRARKDSEIRRDFNRFVQHYLFLIITHTCVCPICGPAVASTTKWWKISNSMHSMELQSILHRTSVVGTLINNHAVWKMDLFLNNCIFLLST